MHTRPAVAEKYPVMIRITVLFPLPLGPSSAATSPRATVNETSSTARVAP
jgi:hypothetical protein